MPISNSKYLTEGLVGYLSAQARLALDGFLQAGMDQDLAVAVVEYILPEDKVWELPDVVETNRINVDTF